MKRRRLVLAAVLCGLSAELHGQAPAQATPDKAHLRIRAVGGFLGQAAGFPEYPGGPEDNYSGPTPLGGTLGVNDWLSIQRRDPGNLDEWLIIAPNNETSDLPFAMKDEPGYIATPRPTTFADERMSITDTVGWFWNDVIRMNPDVVALGPDDFIRSLRAPLAQRPAGAAPATKKEPVVLFIDRLRSLPLPFLATNVAVRRQRPNLNSDGKGPIKWSLDEDASVSWISPITLTVPCSAVLDPRLTEARIEAPQAKTPITFTLGAKPGTCDETYEAKLQLDGNRSLRPGRLYEMTITGSITQTLSFQTDELLTPPKSPAGPDLPYAVRCRETAQTSQCGSSIVVSLVDPAVKTAFGEDAWKYKTKTGDGVTERREIVFLDAVKVVQTLLAEVSAKAGPPIVTVVSSLSDESTLDALTRIPQVRAVVLAQDTEILGTAWPVLKATPNSPAFSGDLGGVSEIDPTSPGTRKFVVRPEWFGETAATIDALATRIAGAGQPYWNLEANPDAEPCPESAKPAAPAPSVTRLRLVAATCLIEGWPLKSKNENGMTIYSATDTARRREVPIAAANHYSNAFSAIWADADKLIAAMAMAIREAGESELSVLPKSAIDFDYLAWIGGELTKKTTTMNPDFLSRYMVPRVLYQSPRMVRGYVTGADLVATLKKIADGESDQGICILGLSGQCTSSIGTDHAERTTVNGRRIDPRLTYGIAMPDGIAHSFNIPHSEHDPLFDAISGVDRGFQRFEDTRAGQASRSPGKITRYGGYWLMSPMQLGYSQIDVDDPGNSKVRPALPIDFKDAKETRGISIKFNSDATFVDAPRWAVRLPMSLDYQWNHDLTEGAVHPISHDTDEFSVGARGDLKLHVLQEMRVYGGWSIDGQTSKSQREITPTYNFTTVDGLSATAKAAQSVPVEVPPSQYRGWGFGADIVPTKSLKLGKGADITLTTGNTNIIFGSSSNVLTGVFIDGKLQETEPLALKKGLEGLFSDYFDANHAAFAGNTPVSFRRERVFQTRAQFDGTGELHTPMSKLKLTWTPLIRYRKYSKAKTDVASPLDLSWTAKLSLGLKVPVWSNITVEPMVQKDWAQIQAATENRFTQLKVEIKLNVPIFTKMGRDGFFR